MTGDLAIWIWEIRGVRWLVSSSTMRMATFHADMKTYLWLMMRCLSRIKSLIRISKVTTSKELLSRFNLRLRNHFMSNYKDVKVLLSNSITCLSMYAPWTIKAVLERLRELLSFKSLLALLMKTLIAHVLSLLTELSMLSILKRPHLLLDHLERTIEEMLWSKTSLKF